MPVAVPHHEGFEYVNAGYDAAFRPNRLSVGLTVPIEAYPTNPVPTMERHLERIRLVESLGFQAIWVRDVPFNVPSFGDTGQPFDPFVYLGLLAGQTERIALGVASIVLPLRHPAHVAKAAASIDALSGGRLILGVASGDRPEEYPALRVPFETRGARFRASFEYVERMREHAPTLDNAFGDVGRGLDMIPKPPSGRFPLLITGGSQQDADWLATHGDGWMVYPRDPSLQGRIIDDWRARGAHLGRPARPVIQPLYVDLTEDDAPPRPIHLGYRLSLRRLRDHLRSLESVGVNHVALNLRFNTADVETTLARLADELLPEFSR